MRTIYKQIFRAITLETTAISADCSDTTQSEQRDEYDRFRKQQKRIKSTI